MPTIVFYISGHGFGHASRAIEVINAIGAIAPSTRIVVRTAAPKWLFDLTVKVRHEFQSLETDTGIVQPDSLSHDIPQTMRRAASFYADFEARAEREASFLRALPHPVVLGDIPPLAFSAAARAGVPAYAMGNFTWDWIYEGYEETGTLAPGVVGKMRDAYAHALEAWRLPMHGGFESVDRVIDVPFVARHASHGPEETRRAFGLPLDRKIVLSSFGGYGLRSLPFERVDCLDEYALLVANATTGHAPRSGSAPANVFLLGETDIYDAGYRYEDLVRASDVVLTKPGYGIIAECVANDTALVYTSRGAFREYDVLVREMPKLVRCAFIDHDALLSGRWRAVLDRALSLRERATQPATNGAEIIAEKILGRT